MIRPFLICVICVTNLCNLPSLMFRQAGLCYAQDSMNVSLLFHWEDTTLPSTAWINNTYNEVWGFTSGSREYAVIGSTMGAHIFDVTDPLNAYQAAFVLGSDTGTSIVHRDFHDYKGYLYMVSDEGASTLQIADLSYLPDSVVVVYDSDTLFAHAHNIFIDSAKAKMYVCGGGANYLSVYSLADPINPVLLVNCRTDVPFWASIGYIHDIYVRNDTAYCNAFYAPGLFVVDFSFPQNPQLLGSYNNLGENHSGWLSENGKIYILAREKHGKELFLYDVSDLSNITVLSQFNSGVDPNSIAHNPIIKGNHVFSSYYYDGLQIFDISDPANPVKTGYYDTYPLPNDISYKGAWGVYPLLPSGIVLVSDMQSGLYVFDVSQATGIPNPQGFQNLAGLKGYPNPFNSSITVSFSENVNGKITLELYDVIGRKVLSESKTLLNSNTYIIERTGDLPGGIYILEVRGEKIIHHQKIIKAATDK